MCTSDPVFQTQKVYDAIAKDYAYRNKTPNEKVLHSLQAFADMLPPGGRVLDVGCAEGRETEWFLQKGFSVVGCDLNDTFIRMARKRCPSATFITADMRALPAHIGTFDGLWACASFLHIPKQNALQTLQDFKAVLKPGGTIYIGVLKGTFEGMRENVKMGWAPRHFSDYEAHELNDLLHEAGFEAIQITDSPRPGTVLSFLNAFAKRAN